MKNWFLLTAFAVLAVLDLGLAPALVSADGAGPDFLLLLTVFVAARAPWSTHPLFHLGLGTFSDLLAMPRPGLRGFAYVAVAAVIERYRPGGVRSSPLLFAGLCTVAAAAVELLYLAAGGALLAGSAGFSVALRSALMTGAAGLLLGWPANLGARLFRWPPLAASMTWRQRMAAAAAGAARLPRGAGR